MTDEPHADDRLTPYAEALDSLLEHLQPLTTEMVPVEEALGAFLAEPARARSHSPRFEQSAMDGFAVRLDDVAAAGTDTPVSLCLAGSLPAGDARRLHLKPGQTIKVFTGSRLPGGTEAVVMKEFVTVDGDRVAVAGPVGASDNIRRVGEEYRRGDEILPAGTLVTPPVVGMLAMLGRKSVEVGRRPRVTVIVLGDELVAPGEAPGPGRIPDANGPALAAALRALGVHHVESIRVGDDRTAVGSALAGALDTSDLVITAGGASVGDHDHVPAVRSDLGIVEQYRRLAVKPGKPNYFGLSPEGVPVFGLPGNPVSALVSFHQLVKPAIRCLMGGSPLEVPGIPVRLTQAAEKDPGRMEWLRGRLTADSGGGFAATPDRGQGSHMLSGLARADVLIELDRDCGGAAADESVTARRLEWRF